jgi:hypothetical protein
MIAIEKYLYECVIFRFAIADLQPLSKRRPLWIQAVHKDFLSFDMKQIQFQSNLLVDNATSMTITSENIEDKLDFHLIDYISNNSTRIPRAELRSSNVEMIK